MPPALTAFFGVRQVEGQGLGLALVAPGSVIALVAYAGAGQVDWRLGALIDPKPLTRRSIADLLAKAFPECGMVAASTCEELLEIDETRIGRPN